MSRQPTGAQALVIDTNIALDLLVFDDPAARPLRAHLERGLSPWITTGAMRVELARVLSYAQLSSHLLARALTVDAVMAQFDRLSRMQAEPPRVALRCSDPDDQMFVDLAVAQRSLLLSKDAALLRLRKRLAGLGVTVQDRFIPAS